MPVTTRIQSLDVILNRLFFHNLCNEKTMLKNYLQIVYRSKNFESYPLTAQNQGKGKKLPCLTTVGSTTFIASVQKGDLHATIFLPAICHTFGTANSLDRKCHTDKCKTQQKRFSPNVETTN